MTIFRWSPRGWHGWRRLCLRIFGAKIASDKTAPSRVWPDVDIYFPWKLTLGVGTLVGPGCRIYNLGEIKLDLGVNLSRHVHLCSGTHDLGSWAMPLITKPITVGENAWLGSDVFVGPGVTIGEYCVVGARAVVVKDQPAHMVCAGNPSRPLKPRPPLN